MNDQQFYDFSAQSNRHQSISMETYRDTVVLVVNTASNCGFTPQYEGLEKLQQQYGDRGFTVLAFPCNQFGKQESGSDEEIRQFCDLTFNISFPLFAKVEVNGRGAHPIYQWLKREKGGLLGDGIKWNFTKFLIDRQGRVVKRYAPTYKPELIRKDIEALLG
ncbi:glutathione peroxidase [Ferrimonas futtsuensis]|uniref:glutathione peroxidase n=1 Tax=Ferrimonas futtsuensis TaxID=364764 RepID=UPI0003FABFA2|nr:glutathione peroxidase [Ferrimonas futtsuensis]